MREPTMPTLSSRRSLPLSPAALLATPLALFALAVMLLAPGSAATAPGAAAGDAEHGRQLFERRCTGCHALDHEKEGPRLRGVYGRRSGSVSTFTYSDALKKAEITWNDVSLDRWLADPDKFVADNDMDFHLEKADERADVIAYLKQLSGK